MTILEEARSRSALSTPTKALRPSVATRVAVVRSRIVILSPFVINPVGFVHALHTRARASITQPTTDWSAARDASSAGTRRSSSIRGEARSAQIVGPDQRESPPRRILSSLKFPTADFQVLTRIHAQGDLSPQSSSRTNRMIITNESLHVDQRLRRTLAYCRRCNSCLVESVGEWRMAFHRFTATATRARAARETGRDLVTPAVTGVLLHVSESSRRPCYGRIRSSRLE